jgi:hypothetical protein
MKTFAELASSRKAWLADVLAPWCRVASLKDLRLAELEWVDIAGKVDPEKTLWFWAWGRFPKLVHDELTAIDETRPVTVVLKDGAHYTGYPDARQSQQGQLVLLGRDEDNPRRTIEHGPFAIDEIVTISGDAAPRDTG